ncbi:MAG: GTP-binding protein [Betaproteobacteria bacterium]|nr:GTP-binding protein [Betaproteobacteria bacterium]
MSSATLVPVTLLTGFLGSGKTTLLRQLLTHEEFSQSAVLINEIGEVGLDHHLVREVHDTVTVLSNGCLCCTVQSDLVNALRELLFGRGSNGIARFTSVFVETTGLADPAPVARALMSDPHVMQHYRLDAIVTAVDAVFGMQQLDAHRESVKQVAVADRIVLTKCDLAEPAQQNALTARLRVLNPAAPIVPAVLGAIEPALLLDTSVVAASREPTHVTRWLAAHLYQPRTGVKTVLKHKAEATHDELVRSFVLRFSQPLASERVLAAIKLLCSLAGERILRVKGLLNVVGETLPMVLHGVQHVTYPLVRLSAWPDQDRRSVLVFVVRDLDPDFVYKTMAGVLGHEVILVPRVPIAV